MANNRNITELPKDIFTNAMPEANVPDKEVTAVIGTLSSTCTHFNRMLKEELTKRAMRTLCQAVIDDDRKTVKRILVARPDLLLLEPPKNLVIESKLTWQKFHAEKIMLMAAKRRQIKILELLNELEQTKDVREAKAQALSAWKIYETKKNAESEDEIVIPSGYTDYAKSLIDVFSKEMFLNGIGKYEYGMLSEKTETALSTLFNRLLPDEVVKLDDYLDIELFLLAFYKAYWDENVLNWNQRDAFCIRAIGLIQSVLTPETAKIFCESLDGVVTAIRQGKNIEISKEAMLHKLKSGESYYRKSRLDFSDGVGSRFFVGMFGLGGSAAFIGARAEWQVHRPFGILMSNKNFNLTKLMQPHRTKKPGCVIS